jgi:hypothetical protein
VQLRGTAEPAEMRSSGAPLEIRNLHGKGYGLELAARR